MPTKLFLIGILMLSLGGSMAMAQTTPSQYKGTYVLVHGAWGGSWAFREVDRLLTAEGYRVYRPGLTGQGERSHLSSPSIDLNHHIQDVVNVLEWEQLKDVILVGHSYGGMVISGVVDRVPDRIKHIIYLDAFVPENGESVNVIRALPGAAPLNTNERDGFLVPTWLQPNAPIPHDVNMPAKAFSQPIELKNQEAARKVPTSYVLTADSPAKPEADTFFSSYERAKARSWNAMVMQGDHNVQWSRPKELAKYLLAAPAGQKVTPSAPSPDEATPQGRPTVGVPEGKSTFVLVHGAWGGGMHWKNVDEMLSRDGHHVRRASLTGQGQYFNLSSPDIDLTTHINDVVNVILWDDLKDVVLMGHSYGGMVITGVADRVPDRIRKIIYLDAFVPEDGQSLNTARGGGGARAGGAARGGAGNMPGFRTIGNYDPNRPPPKDVPQSEKTFSETLSLKNQDAVKKIPHIYVLTATNVQQPESDQFYWAYQRAQGKGWKMVVMEGDHNVHMTRAAETVKMLEEQGRRD